MDESKDLKRCSRCRAWKPRSEFHRKRTALDGLNSCCKSCATAKSAAWYKANREHAAVLHRANYAANIEVRRTRARAYHRATKRASYAKVRARYADDPEAYERQKALVRAWIKAHPDRMAEHNQRKRAKRAGVASGPVDADALWTGLCGICDDPLGRDLQWPDPLSKSIDHIVPLARGGTHTQDNLQWAHLVCNTAKGARTG